MTHIEVCHQRPADIVTGERIEWGYRLSTITANQAVKAPRSVAIDLVRVFGVVAIVAGHTWDHRHFVQAGLYTWHVPVFFVITGYLWKPERTVRQELVNRAKTLLVPYAAWLILVTVIWLRFRAARGEPLDLSLLKTLPLGGNWIARPYSAFWFVTCLFFAAVFLRWLEKLGPFFPWLAAAVGITWAAGDPSALSHVPLGAGLALPAIGFLLVGQLLRRYRTTITRPLAAGLLLALPSWWLGWSGAVDTLNMKSANLGTPLVSVVVSAAISCGLILIAESVAQKLPAWSNRVVLVLAACAIPMILTHTLSLAITERLGYPSSKWTFLVAYFVPLALALALRKTALRKILL